MSHGLVTMIYTQNEHRDKALALLDATENLSTTTNTQSSPQIVLSVHIGVDQKLRSIVYAIKNHFKKEDRFTGKIWEEINEYMTICIETRNYLNINSDQKMKLLHHTSVDGGKWMYRSSIPNKANSFVETCDILRQKFHSPTPQNHIRKNL